MGNESKEVITFDGRVDELLPGGTFKVRLDGGQVVHGYLGGRLRLNKIRITMGDRVRMDFSPYDLTKGRVVYRY